jgi:drug/metabolite transporter (DMT)-like permease
MTSAKKRIEKKEKEVPETRKWTILLVLFCAILGAVGQVLIKFGTNKLNSIADLFFNWYIIIGLGIYVFGTLLFIVAIKYGEITILYPLIATSYIWVSFLSIKYLNETMTHLRWVGIFFIIGGVSLVGYSAKKRKRSEK